MSGRKDGYWLRRELVKDSGIQRLVAMAALAKARGTCRRLRLAALRRGDVEHDKCFIGKSLMDARDQSIRRAATPR